MKILVLGATGMLGHQVFNEFNLNTNYECVGTSRQSNIKELIYLDVTDINKVIEVIDTVKPQVIINCIGVIKQRISNLDYNNCIYVNSIFPKQLSMICVNKHLKLIHISTDCVFSGNKGMYNESDLPDPEDSYGRTKFLGEPNEKNTIVIRTSIIGRELNTQYGLLEWVLSQKNNNINGYTNHLFSGLTTTELSKILINKIVPNIYYNSGLFHIASSSISKFELIQLINNRFNLNITINPYNSVKCDRTLNGCKFNSIFKYTPPNWNSMIGELI